VAGAPEHAELRRTVAIAAPPETVWGFLVDPARAALWMGEAAQLDPRPGGLYRVEVLPGHVARGEFVELDPPRRLVYTWGWEPAADGTPSAVPPGTSTVEVVLEPSPDGTLLRFRHHDLPGAEAATSHAGGWDHYLPRLATAAAGGDPGRDPWLAPAGAAR
jgi:uncharacterized protein YndB with AHSA1/START domain